MSDATNNINNVSHSSRSSNAPSAPKFNPDDAMNAALSAQVGSIFNMADLSLSLSKMSATLEETAVANGTADAALKTELLNAQGFFCGKGNFESILKAWTETGSYPKTGAGFENFLKDKGLDPTKPTSPFYSLYNNPNLKDSDRDTFATTIINWYNESNADLQTFQGKTSVIAQQLTQSTANLQDWQNIDSSLKPTQEQNASQQLMAELSAEADMFSDIVAG